MKDIRTKNLFSQKNDLRLCRITKQNINISDLNLTYLKDLIIKHQDFYPDIDKWFDTKVIPGLKSGERIAYIGFCNNVPIAAAVLKLGKRSKFCHVSIVESFQNANLGEILFSMMVMDAKRWANSIHFTLPESLWINREVFFKSFGFTNPLTTIKQYRPGEKELFCEASFNNVWHHALQKFPKIINTMVDSAENVFNGLLLSIKPAYAEKILNKKKTVEIRRKFDDKWISRKVVLYSSSPIQALVGQAFIDSIIKGPPEYIWQQFNESIGITKEEYDNYTADSQIVSAIVLKDVSPYNEIIPLEIITFWIGKELKAPQSYLSLKNNPLWTDAVSIAELLHNRFTLDIKI